MRYSVFRIDIISSILVFLIILIISSCSNYGQWSSRVDWLEPGAEDFPSGREYPDYGAIILLDEGKMEIFGSASRGFSSFARHKIIKILDSRGQKYANVMIPYTPSTEIKNIRARTISGDGEIFVLEEKDIYDVNLYPSFVFYSDQRAKIFTMPAIGKDAIIEYEYELLIGNRTLWHSWVFQTEIPTLKSRFTIVNPGEWNLNYRLYNMDLEPTVVKAPAGFSATYSWEVEDLPALKTEFGMPHQKELLARLAFAPVGVNDWQDVSQWYHELAEPQINSDQNIDRLARGLTAGLQSKEQKLRKLYEWVRDNVRYIAVEVGIGGFKPYPADRVLKNQYGDCKDMSTLLCALAREADIEVYEVLVSTRPNGSVDTSLASPYQFNHAIAFSPDVGRDGLWMDATEKGCPFGNLPWYDQGVDVLVVGKDGRGIMKRTPTFPADSNRTLVSWQIDLEGNGSAQVSGRTEWWGAMASEIREDFYFSSDDHIRQWLQVYLAKRCSGARLDSFQIQGLTPVRDPLVVTYSFATAHFLSERSGNFVMRPYDMTQFELPDYFGSIERKHPIQFQFGSVQQMKLTISTGNHFQMLTPQFTDSVQSPFGSASWSLINQENKIVIQNMYSILGERVPASSYRKFQEFLDRVRLKNMWEVLLSERGTRVVLQDP